MNISKENSLSNAKKLKINSDLEPISDIKKNVTSMFMGKIVKPVTSYGVSSILGFFGYDNQYSDPIISQINKHTEVAVEHAIGGALHNPSINLLARFTHSTYKVLSEYSIQAILEVKSEEYQEKLANLALHLLQPIVETGVNMLSNLPMLEDISIDDVNKKITPLVKNVANTAVTAIKDTANTGKTMVSNILTANEYTKLSKQDPKIDFITKEEDDFLLIDIKK